MFCLFSFVQKNECFRAAVEMTGKLLIAAKQGPDNIGQITLHTPHTLQVGYFGSCAKDICIDSMQFTSVIRKFEVGLRQTLHT